MSSASSSSPARTASTIQAGVLGTDPFGRDYLSRLIYGARISMVIGVLTVITSGLIGITLGGIGTGGMTPFEYLLAGRGPGDEICFRVTRPDMEQFFEHLVLAFCAPFKDRDEVHFQVRITGIEPADGREIVRALAELTAHAGSGGCDCGCWCG